MKMHDVLMTRNMQMPEIPIYDTCQNITHILFPQPIFPFPIMHVYIQLFLGRFLEAKKQKYCYFIL